MFTRYDYYTKLDALMFEQFIQLYSHENICNCAMSMEQEELSSMRSIKFVAHDVLINLLQVKRMFH